MIQKLASKDLGSLTREHKQCSGPRWNICRAPGRRGYEMELTNSCSYSAYMDKERDEDVCHFSDARPTPGKRGCLDAVSENPQDLVGERTGSHLLLADLPTAEQKSLHHSTVGEVRFRATVGIRAYSCFRALCLLTFPCLQLDYKIRAS
eukprot:4335014-Amphidinium_carterae.1